MREVTHNTIALESLDYIAREHDASGLQGKLYRKTCPLKLSAVPATK